VIRRPRPFNFLYSKVPERTELEQLVHIISERTRRYLERLCRYDLQGNTSVARGRKPGATITRPAIAEPRLSLTPTGNVRYQLKTPYGDGTTHAIFEPLDFMARLVALVPQPRVNLTRYHGVFAPNSPWRRAITPGRRGKGAQRQASDEVEEDTPAARRSAMAGFCSCKTGIHAIHGNKLATAPQARVPDAPGQPLLMLRINSPCRC